jgi:hypothetical protein
MAQTPPSKPRSNAKASGKKTARICIANGSTSRRQNDRFEVMKMVSKVEREQAAIAAAENDLAERKKRLAALKKEEAEKELAKLTRKVGPERAIKLLELAVKVKPKTAIEMLEKAAGGLQGGGANA